MITKTAANDIDSITVRPATPMDSPEAARLIFMTGKSIFKYLLYQNEDKSLAVLKRLFEIDTNDFSYNYAFIAELQKRICGLILFTDRAEMRKSHKAMGGKLIKAMGFFPALIRLPRFIQFDSLFPKIGADTLYIGHLATFAPARGKGVARAQLDFCEQQAKKKNLSKLALNVEVDNRLAIPIYERYGFKNVQKVESPRFKARFGFPGTYRMEKVIAGR